MWYGQLSSGSEDQILATVEPLLNMENVECFYQCNDTNINYTEWNVDKNLAYRAAIHEFKQSLHNHQDLRTIVLLLLYAPVFAVAFFGNTLVLVIVIMNRTMRNVTNLLLLNLAVADLSVSLVCVPIAVGESVYKAWIFGGFMCKFAAFLQGTTVTASVFTISLLSVDRYLAIKKPVISRRIGSPKIALKLIIFIWTTSALPMIPLFLFRKVDEINFVSEASIYFCREDWLSPVDRLMYDVCVCVVVYIIPGFAITTSYALIGRKLWREDENLQRQESEISRKISRQVMNSRKRIAKMLIALAILFTLCWLPYHITCLYLDAKHVLDAISHKNARNAITVLPYTIFTGHANSAINPLIYFYASRSFRRCLKQLLQCQASRELNDMPNKAVVKYTPIQNNPKKPLVRILSSSIKDTRSRSTGSSRFSRSASLRSSRSFRSSGSFRRHETQGKAQTKPTLSKIKDAKTSEKKAVVPKIEIAEVNSPEQCNDVNQTDENLKHRRDIFSCTLSIPTTINEESRSSRPTSPMRGMPSAIPEEDGGIELSRLYHEISTAEGNSRVAEPNNIINQPLMFTFPEIVTDDSPNSVIGANGIVFKTDAAIISQPGNTAVQNDGNCNPVATALNGTAENTDAPEDIIIEVLDTTAHVVGNIDFTKGSALLVKNANLHEAELVQPLIAACGHIQDTDSVVQTGVTSDQISGDIADETILKGMVE